MGWGVDSGQLTWLTHLGHGTDTPDQAGDEEEGEKLNEINISLY